MKKIDKYKKKTPRWPAHRGEQSRGRWSQSLSATVERSHRDIYRRDFWRSDWLNGCTMAQQLSSHDVNMSKSWQRSAVWQSLKTWNLEKHHSQWHSRGSRWERRQHQTFGQLDGNQTRGSVQNWSGQHVPLSPPPSFFSPLAPLQRCFPGCSAWSGTSPSTSAWCQPGELGRFLCQLWKSSTSRSRLKSLLWLRSPRLPGDTKRLDCIKSFTSEYFHDQN